jgi:hypothetical protein
LAIDDLVIDLIAHRVEESPIFDPQSTPNPQSILKPPIFNPIVNDPIVNHQWRCPCAIHYSGNA